MTTAIFLHGAAGKFGGPFHLEVRDPGEAMRALMKLVKGFRAVIADGEWKIIKGPVQKAVEQGRDVDVSELSIAFGHAREMHLVPVLAGAKKAGIGKVIAGVVLVAATFATAGAAGAFAPGAAGLGATFGAAAAPTGFAITYANVAMFGASLVLGGISQMLAGSPKAQSASMREDPTQRVNSLFSGPVNVGELGQCVPLAYGPRIMCGSVVPSAALVTEQRTS